MQVIDYDMPYKQFLEIFEGMCAEWVDGVVYQLPKPSPLHQTTAYTLSQLLNGYFHKTNTGNLISAPNLLRLNEVLPVRCPDLQILLGKNTALLQGREVVGAPDIVIEIISEAQHTIERGDKLIEYEAGGVREYWIIDSIRQDALFYRSQNGYFRRYNPDAEGIFHCLHMQDFHLPVEILWSNPSPSDDVISGMLDDMISGNL